MTGTEIGGDDRGFGAYFIGDGAGKLKEKVKAKLLEFIPDFTDDTLVEYVVVLLRNGRGKDEARKELEVFLGDETVQFVSWLWDHISSNIHVYTEANVLVTHDKSKLLVNKRSGEYDSQQERNSGRKQTYAEHEKEELNTKVYRSRHNRDWRALVKEDMQPFLFQSTMHEDHLKEKTQRRTDHVRLPQSVRLRTDRKRSRQDERQPTKREVTSHRIGPPCRLLQFALRDAVRTAQQTIPKTQPALKRLRSVISTPCSYFSVEDSSQMIIPLEDNIATHRLSNCRETAQEEREVNDHYENLVSNDMEYCHTDEHNGELLRDMTIFDENTEISFGSASENDEYGDIQRLRHQSGSSAIQKQNSVVSKYSVFDDADGMKKARDQDPPAKSRKIVNISVNVNTWKPPEDCDSRNLGGRERLSAVVRGDMRKEKPNLHLSNTANSGNDNKVALADAQMEVQKTVSSTPESYRASRPNDDVNSRILFISNVHFAASKDALSRHFNKFGEVLKVIIVKDTATGQPNGSAFIEFVRKESAEQALALNGTSFMSRVLKVVRRTVARHEAAPLTIGPPLPKASPTTPAPRRTAISRGRFPPRIFSPRLPIKPGARSLQWKRGVPTTSPSGCVKALQSPSLPARSFTYVRSLPKPDTNSGKSNS